MWDSVCCAFAKCIERKCHIIAIQRCELFVAIPIVHSCYFLLSCAYCSVNAYWFGCSQTIIKYFFVYLRRYLFTSVQNWCIRHIVFLSMQIMIIQGFRRRGSIQRPNFAQFNSIDIFRLIKWSDIAVSGWRASFEPKGHILSEFVFDALIGADGKRNTVPGEVQLFVTLFSYIWSDLICMAYLYDF